ncbi:probable serine/threonine-protein kinase pXi [Anopheles ziemanni]|uniref:probable serine/threonine-protein kinase pXi n=1 Tax=Anopheles coustani TaxID=139045 RepID=UPI00265960E5|nr:probable serine/threonine-protein kinase pXi [Anopheles coustani]XP_058173025.1 probable serine/threonine-protein kinase pXi [Anopheles ziemanni]
MIHVDETDPLGDVPPAFPYREVEIQRGVDPKQLYELSSELGRGKFGVVYKSKEKSTGVRLAAKFIQIQKKGDRRNIEREVHMMNVLQHSKIAQLYAAFEFDRTFCVMMELVEGGELFDRVLDDKFILTERACSIFMRQICDAVAYIHGNNIIHLDMKPENILCLTEAGNRIKIIDFGLAREYDPDNKLQVLFGTPEFVAPEVVNFEAISFATDMWSVGVIAYVLVSGLSPFAGEDDIQTMGNITIGRYDFLDEAFDEVSEEAIDFITRCLVKDQTNRLTAEDALKHKWIKRKPQYYPTNRRPSIPNFKQILLETNNNNTNVTVGEKDNNEIDKENLKDLVGKWNDTPNNRYAFEQDTENIIAPSGESVQLRRPTLPEVSGLANGTSGSRRGSIAREETNDNDEDNDVENEAPNGGGGMAPTKIQHNSYYDGSPKEQHASWEQTASSLQLNDHPTIEAVKLREENVNKCIVTIENANDSYPSTNKQTNAPASERNASFDSCQMSVTPNAARSSFESGVKHEVRCGDHSSSSSSICSSDSKASISSLSDGLTSEQATDTNNQLAFANAPENANGGLEPAASSPAAPCSSLLPCSPTDTKVHVHHRTSLSSGFCLSTDGADGEPTSDTGVPKRDVSSERAQESAAQESVPTSEHRDQVRDDLRKLSDLLKLSLTTTTTAVKDPVTSPVSAASEGDAEASSSASIASSTSTVELDSDLENLKSKVSTMIRTSRAQNKLNELAQRPEFLANDPFKLPTFRFLPKSISLCNDDSVFKENYTKFCDRNNGGSQLTQPTLPEEKPAPKSENAVRKKSSTGGMSMRKKKEPQETSTSTSTVTTTTFSSTSSGKIASTTTTVRKTIVKQQKVLDVEDVNSTEPRKSLAPTKSLDSSASSTTTTTTHAILTPTASIKRTKFRVNQMSSRDVPVAPLNSTVARRYLERSGVLGTSKDQPEAVGKMHLHPSSAAADDSVTANNLRNSALKLRSLSVDWDAVDVAVENRSMKTINSFLKRHAVASSAVRQIQAQLEATITTHK